MKLTSSCQSASTSLNLLGSFPDQLRILVSKKKSVELTVDEGWYNEDELKNDLGWSQFSPQEHLF